MARPIRNTPILTGKDATTFIQSASTTPSEEIRRAERNRIEDSVNKLKMFLSKLPK
ncbi:MAG: hypothetical protein MJY63_00680 [Paludibacteraceae bacterium]|nr:hypothetical protein [Paludibacteraceae bacterium]